MSKRDFEKKKTPQNISYDKYVDDQDIMSSRLSWIP